VLCSGVFWDYLSGSAAAETAGEKIAAASAHGSPRRASYVNRPNRSIQVSLISAIRLYAINANAQDRQRDEAQRRNWTLYETIVLDKRRLRCRMTC
jgi:hypothetical protein